MDSEKPEVTFKAESSSSKLPSKKVLMSLVVVLFLVVSVPVGVYLTSQNQSVTPQAAQPNNSSKGTSSTPQVVLPSSSSVGTSTGGSAGSGGGTSSKTTNSSSPLPQSSSTASAGAQIKGDSNKDGKVNSVDLATLMASINKSVSNNPTLDLNNDGVINTIDFANLKKLIGT